MSQDDPYDAQFDDPSLPPSPTRTPGELLKLAIIVAGVLLLGILISFVRGLWR